MARKNKNIETEKRNIGCPGAVVVEANELMNYYAMQEFFKRDPGMGGIARAMVNDRGEMRVMACTCLVRKARKAKDPSFANVPDDACVPFSHGLSDGIAFRPCPFQLTSVAEVTEI